jgi:hypothetical protein
MTIDPLAHRHLQNKIIDAQRRWRDDHHRGIAFLKKHLHLYQQQNHHPNCKRTLKQSQNGSHHRVRRAVQFIHQRATRSGEQLRVQSWDHERFNTSPARTSQSQTLQLMQTILTGEEGKVMMRRGSIMSGTVREDLSVFVFEAW